MTEHCPVCGVEDSEYIGRYKAKSDLFLNKSLVFCKNCATAFIWPMLSEQELEAYYKHYWNLNIQCSDNSALRCYYAQAKARIDYIVNIIGSLANKSILDIGAGHGFFFDVIKKKYNLDFFYTAIDTDIEKQIFFAKKGIRYFQNIREIIDKKFDLIILSHILEHNNNPVCFLTDIKKLLKDNGFIFIEVPNKDYLYKDLLEPHIVVFNINSLSELLKRLNLRILDISSCGRLIKEIVKNSTQESATYKTIGIFKRIMPKIRSIGYYNRYYKLRNYGGDRQWLRAILTLTANGFGYE